MPQTFLNILHFAAVRRCTLYSIQDKHTPLVYSLISLHIRSMWETTVMHKQVSGWTVNFGPNFPESPFLELKTRKPPPPSPHFGKHQIWDDQSLPRNTPPPENFRFGMTKVYSGIPPPPMKTSDLGWPNFTPEYPPPILENFKFGMTKVYSGIPPCPPPHKIVREFQNAESYYMWRLYPTRITTRSMYGSLSNLQTGGSINWSV